ncbi:SseB family protein [Gleimia hominis]|uniref:SseB family protein n=1 Tax=Gleimia hominis TaxID=595468 RepID=A0ABU3IFV9_9ACTO|nr:SseB family protein [Gleimia hominis]MDT3768110.1 SseB family protein [Gleimia hominis]
MAARWQQLMAHSLEQLQRRLSQRVDTTDRGEVLPETKAALQQVDAGQRLKQLVHAVQKERLIAAAVVEASPEGCDGGAGAVKTESGWVLAGFTSADALARWDSTARPVPVPGPQHALLACAQYGSRLIIDPTPADSTPAAGATAAQANASFPHTDSKTEDNHAAAPASEQTPAVRLPRPAVIALAHGDVWLPPWEDDELRNALQTRVGAQARVQLRPSGGQTQVIEVGFTAEVRRAQVVRVLNELAAEPRLRVAAETVQFQPTVVNVA